MNDIQQYGTGQQLGAYGPGNFTPSRALGKQLSRMEGGAMLRAVQVDVEARLTDLKVASLAHVAGSAQQHVASLTAMEAELTKAVPLAASRLEMMGNLAALTMTEMVTDHASKTRRM